MRRLLLFISILILAFFSRFSLAETPNDDQLRQWIKNLNDAERSVRERAEHQLLNGDQRLINRLQTFLPELPVKERKELSRILQDWNYREIIKSPRNLVLELPDAAISLQEAIDVLNSQCFGGIQLGNVNILPPDDFSFSNTKLPFWAAVIELLDHFQLDISLHPGGRMFLLTTRSKKRTYFTVSTDALPSAESTDVAFRINGITRKTIEGQPKYDLLRISFQALFAPHRAPLLLKVPGQQQLESLGGANAPAGQELLLPFSPDAVTEHPCNFDLISPEFRVDWLIAKSNDPKRLHLKLKVQTLEAIGRQEFAFKDWNSRSISQRRGLAVVTRDVVEQSKDQLSILMLILHSHRGAPFESHREWISQTRIHLSQGNQDLTPIRPPEKILEADGTTALKFTFPPPEVLSNWVLKYELPTDFQETTHHVEYHVDLKEWLKKPLDQ